MPEMKSEKGTIKEFNGKKLAEPLDYDYTWKSYVDIDEVRSANKMPDDEAIVKFVNDASQKAARSKAYFKKLEDAGLEKPTLENDPQLRLRTIYNALMASKQFTEAQAREMASNNLGVAWE